MPKLKTNRGAAKRFKRTANGYKHGQSFKRHYMTQDSKSSKRKRQLRGKNMVKPCDVLSIRRMLTDAS